MYHMQDLYNHIIDIHPKGNQPEMDHCYLLNDRDKLILYYNSLLLLLIMGIIL